MKDFPEGEKVIIKSRNYVSEKMRKKLANYFSF